MGLGGLYRGVSLAMARDAAEQIRKDIATGKDPCRERARRRGGNQPFAEVMEQAIKSFAPGWTSDRAQTWTRSLQIHAKSLLNKPISQIDTDAVIDVLQPIMATKVTTAFYVQQRIARILDWAKTQELRDGENPARWDGHLEHKLPQQLRHQPKHNAALPYQEMPELMERTRALDGLLPRALEILTLTVCRGVEVVHGRWEEIDFERGLWTIPKARVKMRGKVRVDDLIVPLSAPALEALGKLPRTNALIFPGPRNSDQPYAEESVHHFLQRIMSYGKRATVNGLRKSFKNWSLERTSFEDHVTEMCLGHLVGSEARRSYALSNLIEKRRRVMDAWADYLLAIVHLHR